MTKSNWKNLIMFAVFTSLVGATGCAKKEMPASEEAAPVPEAAMAPEADAGELMQAVANLEQGPDMLSAGSVMFRQEAGGVHVTAHLVGVPPGIHGLHVHEIGDCSSPDYKSAGAHFNPSDAIHGSPDDAEHHAGDLGNIVIGDDGSGHLELVSSMLSLGEGADSVLGRGVILHEKPDDFVSQPSGDAGARIACGVVVPPVEGV